jgi:hypothetical protein
MKFTMNGGVLAWHFTDDPGALMTDTTQAVETIQEALWFLDGPTYYVHADGSDFDARGEALAALDTLVARIGELKRDNYRMHLLYEIQPPEKNALDRIKELEGALERCETEAKMLNTGYGFNDAAYVSIQAIRDTAHAALHPHPQETE